MLQLVPAGGGSTVSLSYWPATTAVANAANVTAAATKVCSGAATVIGGQVTLLPGSAITACPAGSYDAGTGDDGCLPWCVPAPAVAGVQRQTHQCQCMLGRTPLLSHLAFTIPVTVSPAPSPLPACSPAGSYCTGNTQPTQCAADKYQPYLGQTTNTCTTCSPAANPRLTSYAGDAYCTVAYVDTACSDGYEYNADTTTCTMCPAGTQRRVGREDACVPW